MKSVKHLFMALSILLIAISCTKMPIHNTEPVAKNISDYKLRFYDQKIKYDVFNDAQFIYVNVQASDFATQYKMLNLGFTVWIDQKGKKKTKKGIVFPQKQPGADEFKRDRIKNASNQNGGDQTTQQLVRLQKQFELTKSVANLIGMLEDNSSEFVDPTKNSYGIETKITFDKKHQLLYQLKFPIQQIFTEAKYADSTFSVGLESGFIQMDYSSGPPQGGGGRGGGPGGSGGGRGGGAPGGGKGGGGSRPGGTSGNTPQHTALTTPIETWFKVEIL